MGRKSREKQIRRKIFQELFQKTTTTRDEMEISISDEMQAAGNLPRIVTEDVDDRRGLNRSDEGMKAGTLTSCILESDMLDILPEDMKNLFVTQYQQGSCSQSGILQDFDSLLKCYYPELFKEMVTFISKIEELCFQNCPNIRRELNKLSRIETFEALTEIEDNENRSSDTITMKVDNDKDDCIEITEENIKKDGIKVEIDNCDDIKKQPHSLQKSTAIEKFEKNSNEISGSVQQTEETHNIELNDETLVKMIENIGENLAKTKYCHKTCFCQEMYKKNTLQFQYLLRKSLTSLYSESKTAAELLNKSKTLSEHLKILKNIYLFKYKYVDHLKVNEEKDKKNDPNIELENVERNKKKMEIDSFINRTDMPNENVFESQKDHKKCTKDIERFYNDIQDSDSCQKFPNIAQETKYYYRRDSEKEIMNTKQAKKSAKETNYSKLHKQENTNTDMNLKQIVTEEIRDFSSEKQPLITIEKIDSKEETRDEINYADGRKDEVVTDLELNREENELVIVLNQDDCIHFEFGINHKKHIFAGNQNDYYLLNENDRIFFKYKDENIQIHFTGNQVFILTEDSEFSIFIRKSGPFHLSDEATQTSPNSNIQ